MDSQPQVWALGPTGGERHKDFFVCVLFIWMSTRELAWILSRKCGRLAPFEVRYKGLFCLFVDERTWSQLAWILSRKCGRLGPLEVRYLEFSFNIDTFMDE